MAPIRRYLRITKYSVLECRIYLDNPALAHSWLLNPRSPVLPRIIESVRPLVLPKLREEKDRAKKKSTKKKGIKDVVIEGDFEVSIFLTETDTRHSLLYKHKHFRDTTQTKLRSNSSRLTGASRDAAIDVDEGNRAPEGIEEDGEADDDAAVPVLLREESEEDAPVALGDIPAIDEAAPASASQTRTSKRRRAPVPHGGEVANSDDEDNEDGLFVASEQDSPADGEEDHQDRPAKRLKGAAAAEELEVQDDKKKLAMDISYEGFAIYGRVLCLVVKRRDGAGGRGGGATPAARSRPQMGPAGGQAMMENWISSTQMPEATGAEDAEAEAP